MTAKWEYLYETFTRTKAGATAVRIVYWSRRGSREYRALRVGARRGGVGDAEGRPSKPLPSPDPDALACPKSVQRGFVSRVVPSPMAASASGKAKISGAGPSASPVRGIFTATFPTHLRRAFQCLSVDGPGADPIWR